MLDREVLVARLNEREIVAFLLGLVSVCVALYPTLGAWGVLFVAVGFIAHELAHRQYARHHGCASRFVVTPFGLLLTLASSLLPVKFLAPGYVSVLCPPLTMSLRAQLDISAAGIAINLLLASVSLPMGFALRQPLLLDFALVNSWLALFNSIPFGPLDGAKVFRLSRRVWVLEFGTALIVLFASVFL